MLIIILIVFILLVEHFTHQSFQAIVTPVLHKIWGIIDYAISFLLRMNEPFGKKS